MTDDRQLLPRTIMWRRIDSEGTDACSFDLFGDNYAISGTAHYQHSSGPARLQYKVSFNADWSSRSALVNGWVGTTRIDFSLSRNLDGSWFINGQKIDGADGLLDVDLGFTPATNTSAIRRLGLAIGREVETTAVWLDADEWCFKPLKQVYRRLSETDYAYRSPSHDYSAILVTDGFGIIQLYPQLWAAVAEPDAAEI